MKKYKIIHAVTHGVELVIENKSSVYAKYCDRGIGDIALLLDYFQSYKKKKK
jgi:hypothetical protein